MTGTAPTVALTLDAGQYAPGDQVTATATISDPDDTTETLSNAVDELGRRDTIVIDRTDPETAVWTIDGQQLLPQADGTVVFPAPNAASTLAVTVTDGQGNTTTATAQVDVVAPMLVGDAAGVNLARYPRQAVGILFNSPGKGVNLTAIKAFPASMLLLLCIKDPITAQMLADAQAARGAHPFLICEHQEPEGDLPPATYIAQQDAVAAEIAALPVAGRALVAQTEKLTEYAELHGKGPWQTWWSGHSNPMSVDCYDTLASGPYMTPQQLFDPPLSWAAAAGVDLAVTEWAHRQRPDDTDGSKLAAAITADVAYLRAKRVRIAMYWDGKGSQFDYTLSGRALAALQAAVAGR